MRGPILWFLSGWLLLGPAGPLWGAEFQVFSRDLDPLTHTEVKVTTPFEAVPARGFIPIKVTIRNNFPQDRTWGVEFRSQPAYGNGGLRFSSSFQVVTPGQSETVHSFMVPLASKLDRAADSELFISVASGRLSTAGTHRGMSNSDWGSVALSNGLSGLTNLDDLATEVAKSPSVRSGEPVATRFEPAALTADWRALTGFDDILMSDKEWGSLEPSVRDAVTGWVRMGGHLHLFGTNGASSAPLGMGKMIRWQWEGLRIPVGPVAGSLNSSSPGMLSVLREKYLKTLLQSFFGTKDFNPVLVFLILAIFAILVGPVNLQVWAKPGQRHRLFITTPIISLSASLILFIMILFSDGLGGAGQRVAFVLLRSQPEERQAHLVQEQIARTGVLVGRDFPAAEGAWLTPVVMANSRWTHIDDRYGTEASFQLANERLGGDWFRSRSEQMHLARAVIPTRARIEVMAKSASGAAPQLFNSLGYGLESFWYKDEAGGFWRSPTGPVPNGQPIQLETASKADYEAAYAKMSKLFSSHWGEQLGLLRSAPNQFFAEVEDASKQMLPTLGSIRWRDDRLFVLGEPISRTPAAPAP